MGDENGISGISLHGTAGGHLPDDGAAALPLGKADGQPGRYGTEGMAAPAAGCAEPSDGSEAGRDVSAKPCRHGADQRDAAAIQLHLDRRAGEAFRVGAVLFSNQHGPLGATQTAKELLEQWNNA